MGEKRECRQDEGGASDKRQALFVKAKICSLSLCPIRRRKTRKTTSELLAYPLRKRELPRTYSSRIVCDVRLGYGIEANLFSSSPLLYRTVLWIRSQSQTNTQLEHFSKLLEVWRLGTCLSRHVNVYVNTS